MTRLNRGAGAVDSSYMFNPGYGQGFELHIHLSYDLAGTFGVLLDNFRLLQYTYQDFSILERRPWWTIDVDEKGSGSGPSGSGSGPSGSGSGPSGSAPVCVLYAVFHTS